MNMKALVQPFVKRIRQSKDGKKQKKYLETQYSKKIAMLKGTAEKERCFIIGNGPSLIVSDLEKLKHEDCFACNRIYGLYERTEWRPKVYCSQDRKVLEQIIPDLPYVVDNAQITFLPYLFRDLFPAVVDKEKVKLFYKPYVSVYSSDGTFPEGIMPFSEDVSWGIYDGLSVTFNMMQIAAYMGYKEIYLLGIDHNYAINGNIVDASKSYAEGIKPIDMSTQFQPELTLCENAFREARRFAEKKGILIRNATRGGKLEVFERIDLDGVLNYG